MTTNASQSCSWTDFYVQLLYRCTLPGMCHNSWHQLSWQLEECHISAHHQRSLLQSFFAISMNYKLFCLIFMQVRFFWHVPLQLASIVLAAGGAPHICRALQANASGTACLSLVTALQMLMGLAVPSFLTFLLDFRISSGYMPHVQPNAWLLSQS